MKKFFVAALLTVAAFGWSAASARAELCGCIKKLFHCHHCQQQCCSQYNAFSPPCCYVACCPAPTCNGGSCGSCNQCGGGMPAAPFCAMDMNGGAINQLPAVAVTNTVPANNGQAYAAPAPAPASANAAAPRPIQGQPSFQANNLNPIMQPPAMGNAFRGQ